MPKADNRNSFLRISEVLWYCIVNIMILIHMCLDHLKLKPISRHVLFWASHFMNAELSRTNLWCWWCCRKGRTSWTQWKSWLPMWIRLAGPSVTKWRKQTPRRRRYWGWKTSTKRGTWRWWKVRWTGSVLEHCLWIFIPVFLSSCVISLSWFAMLSHGNFGFSFLLEVEGTLEGQCSWTLSLDLYSRFITVVCLFVLGL